MNNLENEITSILFQHDPMIINFEDNIGEYNLEAKEIVSLLKENTSQNDIIEILDIVMSKWFGKDWAEINKKYTKKQMLDNMSVDIYEANLKS